MTVQELIDRLRKEPPERSVVFLDPDTGWLLQVIVRDPEKHEIEKGSPLVITGDYDKPDEPSVIEKESFIKTVLKQMEKDERAKAESRGQMTLDMLIRDLQLAPPQARCSLTRPHSYRGYYDQLAFEGGGNGTVATALQQAIEARGKIFQGYKGGNFLMTGDTMVWLANYGQCGERIINIRRWVDQVGIMTIPDED